jgi:CrcB protein
VGRFLWICLGGAAGTGARYLLSGWVLQRFGPTFPTGTFAVNVIGSFVMGGLMHIGMTTQILSPTARLALTTGVMGGFTTYSTFNYETIRYLQDGSVLYGSMNVLATVVTCFLAGIAGIGGAKLAIGG